LAAGPLVAWIAEALEEPVAIEGLSEVGAGLYRFRIPKDTVLWMETALRTHNLVVVAHGAASETLRAREILGSSGAAEVVTHTDGDFAASQQPASQLNGALRNSAHYNQTGSSNGNSRAENNKTLSPTVGCKGLL
jgi:hypothetical protein